MKPVAWMHDQPGQYAVIHDVDRAYWLSQWPKQVEHYTIPLYKHKELSMNHDEQAIEREIQINGLNAPRLSPDRIDAVIMGEDYYVFPGTTLTVCCLTLKNGFNVTGESAAVSPENFDREIGQKIARANARDKIWALEGYLLRDRLGAASDR